MFHKHHWRYMGGERIELRFTDPLRTFFISMYACECGEYSATPVDMQPYLDMKSYALTKEGLVEDDK
jgi:hypothetical protein